MNWIKSKIVVTDNLQFNIKKPFLRKVLDYATIGILLTVSFAGCKIFTNVRVVEKYIIVRDTVDKSDVALNDSALGVELKKLGCMLPNVAIAQFKWETGNFTSNICIENKNIAGIKTSNSEYCLRRNGVVVKNRDHNVYASYRDCLRDYVRIQNRYLKNIDGKYAGDPNYLQNLKKVK